MKTVGIILDNNILEMNKQGKKTYERLGYYAEIGKQLGLIPVFFYPNAVDFSKNKLHGYVWKKGKLIPRTTPIPSVMHNRILTGNKEVNERIRKLGERGVVFNGIVARNKLTVSRMLWRNPKLRPHLPETIRYTREGLFRFLQKYPVVYLKPAVGSVGIGVARIERLKNGYKFISARGKQFLSRSRLAEVATNWVRGRFFVVQQGIMLATYKHSTFDIRVSVQKNSEKQWTYSGAVAKVANPRNQLSNLAQGGEAVPLDPILISLFSAEEAGKVKESIVQLGVAIAKQFEQFHPSLADIGLDLGVDEYGKPYLIEVNVRDQRYSFFRANEMESFLRTYRHPLEYAKSLMEIPTARRRSG